MDPFESIAFWVFWIFPVQRSPGAVDWPLCGPLGPGKCQKLQLLQCLAEAGSKTPHPKNVPHYSRVSVVNLLCSTKVVVVLLVLVVISTTWSGLCSWCGFDWFWLSLNWTLWPCSWCWCILDNFNSSNSNICQIMVALNRLGLGTVDSGSNCGFEKVLYFKVRKSPAF